MRLVFFILFLTIPLGIEAQEETISMDPFGEIHVYQPANHPPVSVLILISGDGGWEHAVLKMAKVLSGEGCLVAGVDINQYLKNLEKESGDCASPAKDFIALGRSVQEKYGIKMRGRPYLVGYSSGATLVYCHCSSSAIHFCCSIQLWILS